MTPVGAVACVAMRGPAGVALRRSTLSIWMPVLPYRSNASEPRCWPSGVSTRVLLRNCGEPLTCTHSVGPRCGSVSDGLPLCGMARATLTASALGRLNVRPTPAPLSVRSLLACSGSQALWSKRTRPMS